MGGVAITISFIINPLNKFIIMEYKRVAITAQAIGVLNQLKEKHGKLIFHQSGGCCDGSAPMIFEEKELMVRTDGIEN